MRLRHSWFVIAVGLTLAACAAQQETKTQAIEGTPPRSSLSPTLSPTLLSGTVSGRVLTEDGAPLAGATVRVQATENSTTSATDGSFLLTGMDPEVPVTVTAWSDGYFVGWADEVILDVESLVITLKPYYTTDNPNYDWFSMEGVEGSLSCSHCMPCYEEWATDAHSQSAVNPRFLTMYNGTDVNGNQSPLTRYGFIRDYGSSPLRPDPDQPYYGPGYKLDFPETAGNCATCHVPAAAAYPGMAYAADPNDLSGIEDEGVFCEFCHKIGEVTLNPTTELPYVNMPGVLSIRLYRPDEEQQLFFGNFDDVTRRVSYLPLIEESAFCAPCHYGVFWDEVIYNSYGEWLESPYSDPETGQTCQDCHMPTVAYDYFVYPEKGGVVRDSNLIFSHQMPGASDATLLQNAVTLDVSAERHDSRVWVVVAITNDKTGHHVPTDSPLRHLILLVQVTDGEGKMLDQLAGPTVPEWGGVGDPDQGYYAGLPGTAFAKVLQELWTEVAPTGSYWNPTRIISDNRIAAYETASSDYTFSAPMDDEVRVEVTLLFRRAFIQIMDWKGWDVSDIVMARRTIILTDDD